MFSVSEIIDFVLLGTAAVCATGAWITARKIVQLEQKEDGQDGKNVQ